MIFVDGRLKMGLFALGILGNLVASSISFVAGVMIGRVIIPRVVRLRSFVGSLLKVDSQNVQPILLAHGYVAPVGATATVRKTYSVEQGDLRAILHTYEVLKLARHNKDIHVLDSSVALGVLSSYRAVLSISGPKWNSVTERLLGKLGCPIVFSPHAKGISVTAPNGAEIDFLETTIDAAGVPIVCHGIVVYGRIELPEGRMQSALICAGRTTLSTQGSVLYLEMLERSRRRRRDLHMGLKCPWYQRLANKRWVAVVRVTRSKSQSGNYSLDETDIDIELIKAIPDQRFRSPYRLARYAS